MTSPAHSFTVWALVFLTSLVGCATKSEAETQFPRELNTTELAELFSDVVVLPEGGSSVKHRYYADGRYEIEHGWRIWGSYTIQNSEVCVVTQTNQVPFCKRYSRNASGDVFLISSRRGDEAPREGPPYTKMSFRPFCTDPEKVPPLSESELKEIFPGYIVTDVSDSSYQETFFEDGQHRIEGETVLWNRYTIVGNDVCIVRQDTRSPFCRKFTKDEAGRILWLMSDGGKDRCMSTPTQYAFRPIDEE